MTDLSEPSAAGLVFSTLGMVGLSLAIMFCCTCMFASLFGAGSFVDGFTMVHSDQIRKPVPPDWRVLNFVNAVFWAAFFAAIPAIGGILGGGLLGLAVSTVPVGLIVAGFVYLSARGNRRNSAKS